MNNVSRVEIPRNLLGFPLGGDHLLRHFLTALDVYESRCEALKLEGYLGWHVESKPYRLRKPICAVDAMESSACSMSNTTAFVQASGHRSIGVDVTILIKDVTPVSTILHQLSLSPAHSMIDR